LFCFLFVLRAIRSHSIVTQHDLNQLFVGEIFDSTNHAGQLLALLFTAMLFGPGLPLLIPLLFVFFFLYYHLDKFLLCRHYRKPAVLGSAVYEQILYYLPVAAFLRLTVSCWMFSNSEILSIQFFASINPVMKLYSGLLISAQHLYLTNFGSGHVYHRLFQAHVFPLLLFAILFFFVYFCILFWKQLPFYWIVKLCYSLYEQRQEAKKKDQELNNLFLTTMNAAEAKKRRGIVTLWDLKLTKDPARQQSAGFIEEFYCMVRDKTYIPSTCAEMFQHHAERTLTDVELNEGFRVSSRDNFVIFIKKWKQDNIDKIDGSKSREDTLKKTYEVIADYRCYSYNIERLVSYAPIIGLLQEGILSMIEEIRLNYQNRFLMKGSYEASVHKLFFEKVGFSTSIVVDYGKRMNKYIEKPKYLLYLEKIWMKAMAKGTKVVLYFRERCKRKGMTIVQPDEMKTQLEEMEKERRNKKKKKKLKKMKQLKRKRSQKKIIPTEENDHQDLEIGIRDDDDDDEDQSNSGLDDDDEEEDDDLSDDNDEDDENDSKSGSELTEDDDDDDEEEEENVEETFNEGYNMLGLNELPQTEEEEPEEEEEEDEDDIAAKAEQKEIEEKLAILRKQQFKRFAGNPLLLQRRTMNLANSTPTPHSYNQIPVYEQQQQQFPLSLAIPENEPIDEEFQRMQLYSSPVHFPIPAAFAPLGQQSPELREERRSKKKNRLKKESSSSKLELGERVNFFPNH
jgi:hypothetical protein